MSPKRPGTMSDADRANIGRRHRTNPFGVEVDPESTPPPQEPPSPRSLDGYDSIPPPIALQLEMLAEGLGNVTSAIGRVWDSREGGTQLKQIDAKLATLAESATKHGTMLDEFVMPGIKDLMKAVDGLVSPVARLVEQVGTVSKSIDTLDKRLRDIEVNQRLTDERHDSTSREVKAQLASHDKQIKDADGRLDVLERKDRDREVVTKALAKKERVKSGGIGAVVAAVVSAIAAVIAKFVN